MDRATSAMAALKDLGMGRLIERGADLIICGSRGFGRLKSVLLGSVSQKITQLAECSCLTVK